MKRVAVISAILEKPEESQGIFNDIVAAYKHIIKGRMGLPLIDGEISVISIILLGEINEINSLNGKLGKIPNIQVKTSLSKKEID